MDIKDFCQNNKSVIGPNTKEFFCGSNSRSVRSSLIYNHFISDDDKTFSDIGNLFFANNGKRFFEYVNYSSASFSQEAIEAGSYFEQLLSVIKKFDGSIPKYEDRSSSIERRTGPEISKRLFTASLAKIIINSNPRTNMILIEQSDSFNRMIIRSLIERPQLPEMKAFVSFIRNTGIVPFYFYSDVNDGSVNGLVHEEMSNGIRAETILYYSYAYKEGILGRNKSVYNLSYSEQKVLDVIKLLGSARRSDIVFKTGMPPRTASYSLTRLLQYGFIQVDRGLSYKERVYRLSKRD